MTINVAEINVAETDNVPKKRGRGRPRNAIPTQYWGKDAYYNVTLHIDPAVGKALKIMAIKENTTIGKLASEAIAVYLKWLYKAAKEEAKEIDMEEANQELEKSMALVEAVRIRRFVDKMTAGRKKKFSKALKSKRSWRREFPDRKWPGKIEVNSAK